MILPDPERWQRLSPLLDELLDLDADARRERLAELRAGDPALADELDGLLQASARADAVDFLAGQASGTAAMTLAGKQVGAYVIEAPLGEGGTGSVWRARRADGRYEGAVAIKLLHLSLVGRAGAQRFAREGAFLARLSHPNIGRLLDAGVLPEGQPYLVLELVEGERIDRHCDARRLSVEQRLALFDEVLAAVAHAHSHLVIHRDIKPTNILVTADGHVKLLDFGIAKLVDPEPGEAVTETVQGQRALTPGFAAPEQLLGGPITTATDVYALGVLLYLLLAGRHPTASDMASAGDLLRATLDTEPPKLVRALDAAGAGREEGAVQSLALDRSTTLPKLRRQLRGDLDTIVAHMLRKEAARRYQTAAAVAQDLRRCRSDEPVSVRPDSAAYRAAKFVRRHRAAVVTGVFTVLAVAAGVTGTIVEARRAEGQALGAQRERDKAQRQLAYAEAGNEFLTFLLEERGDHPFTTTELLTHGEAVVERQFADDPALRASLSLALASEMAQAGQTGKARGLMQRAQAEARRSGDLSLQADIDCQLGGQYSWSGEYAQASALYEAALARLRAAPEPDRYMIASCLYSRSEMNNLRGNGKLALADALSALEWMGPPRAHERSMAINIRMALANAQGNLGQLAAAVDGYEGAIADLERMGRGRTRSASVMLGNMAQLLARSGQVLRAARMDERALEMVRAGGGDESDPTLEGNYALLLIDLGRQREAMHWIDHARAEAAAQGNKLLAAIIALQGAPAWCETGQLARCADLLEAAGAGLTGVLPPGHSRFGRLKQGQAELSLARGDLARARIELQQAVAIDDAAPDGKNRFGLRALSRLARTELQLGDLEPAEAHATRAVARARAALAGFAHSEALGNALLVLGEVQQARGRAGEARATFEAALAELVPSLGEDAPATQQARRMAGRA